MNVPALRISTLLLPFLNLFIGASAFALPMPKPGDTLSALQSEHFTRDYNFEGIVGLNNCSGSLIRFEASKDTDTAVVLTNGHCLESGPPAADIVVSHQESDRSFSLLNAAGESVGELEATEIVYASMKKTDITLYQLKETYAEILSKFGIHALTLSSSHPKAAQAIEVISGYWHKGYSCSVDTFVPELREDQWTWMDSIRYTRPGCEVIGGTSGSPIVLKGTRTVIGINNTINESGEKCTFDNPCEVDSSGQVSAQQGNGYGQETFWIYSCLDPQLKFNLNQPGCQLAH